VKLWFRANSVPRRDCCRQLCPFQAPQLSGVAEVAFMKHLATASLSIGTILPLFCQCHEVQLDPCLHPHLDHGYAVTSHSSQGQTADRVLIHVDTELAAKVSRRPSKISAFIRAVSFRKCNTVVKLCESHLANRHRTRRHSEDQMPADAEQSRSCFAIRVWPEPGDS
jgi:hypothetical protein